ncbi:MAG: TlpA disulfide reductase family protein [Pseudoxanthomonas sp.]
MRLFVLILAVVPALPLAACKPAAAPAPAATQAVAAAPVAAPAARAAPDPDAPLQLRIATSVGARFDLADHRGRWVVLNFWASWCKPCLQEMPDLSALARRRTDLQLLGLAWDEPDAAEFAAFVKAHPVAYPLARVDMDAPPAGIEPPRGLPSTWVVDPHGKVVRRFLGIVTPAQIEAVVDGKAPAP